MRVLVALGLTLAAASVTRAQDPSTGRSRSITDVIEEELNGRAPVDRGAGDAAGAADGAWAEAATTPREGGAADDADRPAANGLARSLLDGDVDRMAVTALREAIRDGEANAETHYLLAEGLLKEARSLRDRADEAAARGVAAEADRLRSEAEVRIGEALGALGRGRDHAYTVMNDRVAAGDLAGARNLGNALLRVDPNDPRARAAIATADGLARTTTVRSAPASATGGATTGGAGSGGAGSGGAGSGGAGSGGAVTGGAGAGGTRLAGASGSPWDRYGSDASSPWDRDNGAGSVAASNPAAATGNTGASERTAPGTAAAAAPPATGEQPAAATTEDPLPGRGHDGVSQADLEVLARIIKGEALQCSFEGKVAVAAVVLNRVRDGRWPSTIPGVAHQRLQFSCYNANFRQQLYCGAIPEECWRAARAAVSGQDPTGGATHYYNPYLVTPDWARDLRLVRRIGTNRNDTHVFYR